MPLADNWMTYAWFLSLTLDKTICYMSGNYITVISSTVISHHVFYPALHLEFGEMRTSEVLMLPVEKCLRRHPQQTKMPSLSAHENKTEESEHCHSTYLCSAVVHWRITSAEYSSAFNNILLKVNLIGLPDQCPLLCTFISSPYGYHMFKMANQMANICTLTVICTIFALSPTANRRNQFAKLKHQPKHIGDKSCQKRNNYGTQNSFYHFIFTLSV